MKKRIRLLAFLFALTVGVGCIPVAALEERDAQMSNDLDIPFVEWTYDNSMVITAITSDSRAFSPADFPGISCKKVFMLKKGNRYPGDSIHTGLVDGCRAGT